MSVDLVLITCDSPSCSARIALRADSINGWHWSPGGVYEIECLRCGRINLLYWTQPGRSLRTALQAVGSRPLELAPDEYLQDAALQKRHDERRKQREAEEQRQLAIARGEEQQRAKELLRQQEAEARKAQQEAEAAAARANSRASDDDGGDDGGGRSSNDDRSDSMNPNNDAYQEAMDNRSDQMNPNNEAYWSSRGS